MYNAIIAGRRRGVVDVTQRYTVAVVSRAFSNDINELQALMDLLLLLRLQLMTMMMMMMMSDVILPADMNGFARVVYYTDRATNAIYKCQF